MTFRLLGLLLIAAALTPLPACDDAGGGLRLGGGSNDFSIGSPDLYRNAGMYDAYRDARGVWVYSDGRVLVVLDARCPYDGGDTRHEPMSNQYHCRKCAARFGVEGLARGNSGGAATGKQSLRRLRVFLRGDSDGANVAVRVMPTKQYAQERNEWSIRQSMLALKKD